MNEGSIMCDRKITNFGCRTSLSRVSSRDFWEISLSREKKSCCRRILEADNNFDIDRKKWCKDRWEAKDPRLGRESSSFFQSEDLLSIERRLSLKLFTFHLPEMPSRLVFPFSDSFRVPFKISNRERFQQYGAVV